MNPFRGLLLTLALAATLVVLTVGLRGLCIRFVARYWQGQLQNVVEDQAPDLVARIAELDEVGIPILVEALGSPREGVAAAAKRVLAGQLDSWAALPPAEVAPKLQVLSEALAQHVERFGPMARRDAEDLATWILRWRLDDNLVDRTVLVASCEKVLEAASPRGPGREADGFQGPFNRARLDEKVPRAMAPDSAQPNDRALSPDSLRTAPSPVDVARLAAGSPPIGSIPQTASRRLSDDSRAADLQIADPDRETEEVARLPATTVAGRPGHASIASDAEPDAEQEGQRGQDGPIEHGSPGDLARTKVESGRIDGHAQALRRIDTLELMRRLQASDGAQTAVIQAELVRRGFNAVHVALAFRLFDPDPRVRLELVQRLPGMPNVEAEPWLLWLAEDKDADVRMAAITLLATTRDPALLRRLERIVEKDPDPRIRLQADRLGRSPDGRPKLLK
jgi:hypothetical protein